MNRSQLALSLALSLGILFSSFGFPAVIWADGGSQVAVIPKPAKVESRVGTFEIGSSTAILVEAGDEEARKVARLFSMSLTRETGLPFPVIVIDEGGEVRDNAVVLSRGGAGSGLGPEGYEVEISTKGVVLRAPASAGLFRGTQTLRQLFSTRIIPCVSIWDRPRYEWRGMHLDVCRHFFSLEFVKRFIDLLAYHRMNTFHWHLTEDQGWRLAVNRYPKLAEISAWRDKDGKKYGGFYTQDEVREVVAYAAERYVTVVPEIELPGHALAALAAYPEFSCTGGPFEVGTRWGVYSDVYCAGNDKVFEFLENVLSEVIALFPGQFVHIGGDECPKERWKECAKCQARMAREGLADEHELQSYFVRRIGKFLSAHGKRLVGWDEILEGGLAPNATVMSWRGMSGGIAAARAGHDVVMSPTSHCYFDYQQSDERDEPGAFAVIDLERVYSFEPTPDELTSEQQAHILGAQGNVWTERMEDSARVEFMSVPRMCALAEVIWTPKDRRDYDDFLRRLAVHCGRLDAMKVNYRVPAPTGFRRHNVFLESAVDVEIGCPLEGASVHYTLDGSEPTLDSPVADGVVRIVGSAELVAMTFTPGGSSSLARRGVFVKAKLHPGAKIDRASLASGLLCRTYEGRFDNVSDLAAKTPAKTEIMKTLGLPKGYPADPFGLEIEGILEVPADGVYTFYLSSDDGSRLDFGGELLIDNDGRHGVREVSAQIAIALGLHPLRVRFFDAGGAEALKLEWEGPGLKRQEIPAGALFHRR